MAHPPAPILIICHTFPPAPGIGGRRWAKFAKALARRGHPVHVICARPPRGSTTSPWTIDVEHSGITVHALPRRYPAVITRWPIVRLVDKVKYHLWIRLLPWLCRGNHLDTAIFWRKQLLHKAGDLINAHGIRNVIVSGAPFRSLVHALELKRTHPSIRLVGDLRDPWTWGHLYGLRHLPPERFAQELAMERAVIEGMDAVISPGMEIIRHLHTAYPAHAAKCVQLPHALDPDDLPTETRERTGPPSRLIYAGTWYGTTEADAYLHALITAFRNLRARAPERTEQVLFDLYITTNDTTAPQAMVRAADLQDTIRFHGPLPSTAMFQRIAEADAAIVFTPADIKDVISTKFNELFHLRIPVVHVGAPGAISDLLAKHGLGFSLTVEEVATELPVIITGERPLWVGRSYDTRPFLLDAITDRLVKDFLA